MGGGWNTSNRRRRAAMIVFLFFSFRVSESLSSYIYSERMCGCSADWATTQDKEPVQPDGFGLLKAWLVPHILYPFLFVTATTQERRAKGALFCFTRPWARGVLAAARCYRSSYAVLAPACCGGNGHIHHLMEIKGTDYKYTFLYNVLAL